MSERGMSTWPIVLFGVVGFVVIMVGALGIVGWQSMRKYIALSKQAEAVHTVNEVARDASTAWTRESPHKLCDSASYPVPASIVAVSGKKYMSNMTEWRIDAAADKGFACLKFEMALPQYYQYDYELDSPSSFTAIAHGDLDADGVTSTFTQHGTVRGNGIALDSLVRKNPEE